MVSRAFKIFEAAIKSDQTRITYTYYLHEFMKFAKIKRYDDIPKLKTNQIQKLLENWVMLLSEKGLKAMTIRTKLSGVEHFLDMNKAVYYKKILHKLIPTFDYVPGGEKPYTTEDIQKMLTVSKKLRTKALIHFLASTGSRPGTIEDPVLRIKHLADMKHDCKAIKIYDGSKEGYWAFLHPEAAKALDNYLLSRKLNGEKLTEESAIFANYPKEFWSKKTNYLSSKAARTLISNAVKLAGVERKKDGNRFDKAATYGFRKRFNTILKLNNKINSNIAEKLMAHKLGLDGSYLKPTKEECFAEFIKAIQELTISDEARDKVKIKNLEQETTQIEKLQKQIEELSGWVNYDIDKRIVLEGNFATGEIPFEVPDLPRYQMIRLQQKIIKDPVNYGHLRHLLK